MRFLFSFCRLPLRYGTCFCLGLDSFQQGGLLCCGSFGIQRRTLLHLRGSPNHGAPKSAGLFNHGSLRYACSAAPTMAHSLMFALYLLSKGGLLCFLRCPLQIAHFLCYSEGVHVCRRSLKEGHEALFLPGLAAAHQQATLQRARVYCRGVVESSDNAKLSPQASAGYVDAEPNGQPRGRAKGSLGAFQSHQSLLTAGGSPLPSEQQPFARGMRSQSCKRWGSPAS